MTTEYQNQETQTSQGSSFQTITLAFAGATLVFALLSMGTGLRLSSLQTERMSTIQKSTSVENDALLALQKDLEKVHAELESAKKDTDAAKQKASEQNQHVASLVKEIEKVKSELALANTTIDNLKKSKQQTFEPVTVAPTTEALPQETILTPQASPPASANQSDALPYEETTKALNQQQTQPSSLGSSSPAIESRSESEATGSVATQPTEISKPIQTTKHLTEETITEESAVQAPVDSTSQTAQ